MTHIWRVVITSLALAGISSCTSAGGSTGTGTAQATQSNACINPSQVRKQTIVSDEEIRFELNNGETWSNKLRRACPNLKSQGGFTWEVHGMQVCSNQQTIYVRDDGTPCHLGAFTLVANPT